MNKQAKKGIIKNIVDNEKSKNTSREDKVFGRERQNTKNTKTNNQISKNIKTTLIDKENFSKPLSKELNESYLSLMNKYKITSNNENTDTNAFNNNKSKNSISRLPDTINLIKLKKEKLNINKEKNKNENKKRNKSSDYNIINKKDLKLLKKENSTFNSDADSSIHLDSSNDINNEINESFNNNKGNNYKGSNVAINGSIYINNSSKYDKLTNSKCDKTIIKNAKNKIDFTNTELMKLGRSYNKYQNKLTEMDILYQKEVLYATEYVLDIYEELFATQVSKTNKTNNENLLLLLFFYISE